MFFKSLLHIMILLLILLLRAEPVMGFGQNKVQYEQLHWNYLQSKHFSLYMHQNQGQLPYLALNAIEDAYSHLSESFGFTHKERLPLIIYGNPNLFAQTNIITELLPEEVGGFTELLKNRIAIPFSGSYVDLRHVLHHELAHAFVFGMVFDQIGGGMLTTGIQIPFWFMEGAAEYLSSGWDIEADMFMLDKTIHSEIPPPGPELDGYMAYKGGQSFLYFLASSKGDSAFSVFLNDFRKAKSVETSMKKAFGKSSLDLGKEWIRELKRIYWPEIGRRTDPSKNSIAITSHLDSRDHFNLQPRIAPNCSTIAFFSDHKDYTGILLTDKEGSIKHHISQSGYGGFFESFHPFRSGICWSPDSKRLAFVTKDDGRDEIRIIDIVNKKLIKTIKTAVPSISSPDWSSHGDHLVFTGVHEGTCDIYLYNISTDSLSKLTNSIQTESDPHFSPNGLEIIFSMQDSAMSAKEPASAYGRAPSDLYILNLGTMALRPLASTPWNEKQPCFSPDGNHIAYVSDRNGIDNIYIMPCDSPLSSHPLTDYVGSCSHPDWAGSSIAFSLFQHQGWDIRLIESPLSKIKKDTLAITRWVESKSDTSVPYFLPSPVVFDSIVNEKGQLAGKQLRNTSEITEIVEETPGKSRRKSSIAQKDTATALKQDGIITQSDSILVEPDSAISSVNAAAGKPEIKTDTVTTLDSGSTATIVSPTDTLQKDSHKQARQSPAPYKLKFTPDAMSIGLGMSNFYTPAGQAMVSLSDIMGDHRITIAGDIQGNFKDYMHLFVSYLYLRQRFDIGIGAYHSKDYSYSGIFADKLLHDIENAGFFMLQYPFSMFSRLEFTLFGSHLEHEPVKYEGPTTKTTSLLPSLQYAFDNVLWGITGPVNGIRASGTLRVSPPFSFIDNPYMSIDVDFRHYTHIFKRFVWANRLFAGASFATTDSSPARRYFLGGSENWIFYNVNVDQYERNMANTSQSDFVTPLRGWKYLDITGERAFLFNSEFRFPFVREVSLVWPLPIRIQYINGAAFVDAGNAWDSGESHNGLPFPDQLYGGFGFGMRANLGIFVVRFDRGWPTNWKTVFSPVNYFSLGAEF